MSRGSLSQTAYPAVLIILSFHIETAENNLPHNLPIIAGAVGETTMASLSSVRTKLTLTPYYETVW